MTIFAVLLPDNADVPRLEKAIGAAFDGNYLKVGEKQFLVSAASSTAVEVSNKIGITGESSTFPGSAIVFATSSYFGRAPTPVWDWIKAKLEKPLG